MLELLRSVAQAARQGLTARVVVKVNALTDPALTDALVEAGQAGARIDLIVRGACILRPGVAGLTDNIRVRSVIGRFLEHTRIFYFRWGETSAPQEALYLSSADWMSRNMLRRVEVAWPILDDALRQRVIDECITPYLLDEQDAWELQSSGDYTRTAERGLCAQQALMRLHGCVGP
jgi:polyphosphate kinase